MGLQLGERIPYPQESILEQVNHLVVNHLAQALQQMNFNCKTSTDQWQTTILYCPGS